MKGLKKRRRIHLLIVSTLLLIISTVLVGYSLRDGIAYFRSPAEIFTNPPKPREVFRVGGLIMENGIKTGPGPQVQIEISDSEASILVNFSGILPDLIAENQGIIALGTFENGEFNATEILAKHDESYMPREVADALKERGVFRSPSE